LILIKLIDAPPSSAGELPVFRLAELRHCPAERKVYYVEQDRTSAIRKRLLIGRDRTVIA